MCRSNTYTPVSSIETYFNTEYNSDVLDPSRRTLGLFNISVTYYQKLLVCKCSRIKNLIGVVGYYNLYNPYNILIAIGETNTLGKP